MDYKKLGKGGYRDFLLRAPPDGIRDDAQYNIAKLVTTGDRIVNLNEWTPPVSLSRKTPRTVRQLLENEQERLRRAQLGVAKMDEEPKAEDVKPGEKDEFDPSLVGRVAGTQDNAQRLREEQELQAARRQGRFKRKSRRLFVASDEARRLRQEEWKPWVLKDDEDQLWVGRLDGGKGNNPDINSRNATQDSSWRPPPNEAEAGTAGAASVFFVFGSQGADFNVIPSHRFYRFTRNPQYATLTSDEADQELSSSGPAYLGSRWDIRQRFGLQGFPTAPESSHARLLAHAERERRRHLAENERPSALSSLHTVTGGAAHSAEPDFHENDFDEDFADDEEGIGIVNDQADEDEQKATEDRIQQEMQAAEHNWDEENPNPVDGAIERLAQDKKEMRAILRRRGDNVLYSDDDDDEDDDEDNDSLFSPKSPSTPRSDTAATPPPEPAAPEPQEPAPVPEPIRRSRPVDTSPVGTPSKRRRVDSASSTPPVSRLLTDADVSAVLQRNPNGISAKDLMRELRAFLSLPENKKKLTDILKKIARLSDKLLYLK